MLESQTTERFLSQLSEIQQQFLAELVRTSRNLGDNRAEVGDVFREQLHCYRRAVDDTLRLEHELCEALKKRDGEETTEAGLTRLAADLAESGVALREQLWHTWFETADRMGDGSLGTFVHPLRFWATLFERQGGAAKASPEPARAVRAATGAADDSAPQQAAKAR